SQLADLINGGIPEIDLTGGELGNLCVGNFKATTVDPKGLVEHPLALKHFARMEVGRLNEGRYGNAVVAPERIVGSRGFGRSCTRGEVFLDHVHQLSRATCLALFIKALTDYYLPLLRSEERRVGKSGDLGGLS